MNLDMNIFILEKCVPNIMNVFWDFLGLGLTWLQQLETYSMDDNSLEYVKM